jgi:hypothetical protein
MSGRVLNPEFCVTRPVFMEVSEEAAGLNAWRVTSTFTRFSISLIVAASPSQLWLQPEPMFTIQTLLFWWMAQAGYSTHAAWGGGERSIPQCGAILITDENTAFNVGAWLEAFVEVAAHLQQTLRVLVVCPPLAQPLASAQILACGANLQVDVLATLANHSGADGLQLSTMQKDETGTVHGRTEASQLLLQSAVFCALCARARCAPPPTAVLLSLLRRVTDGFDVVAIPMVGACEEDPEKAFVAHAPWRLGGRSGCEDFGIQHIQGSALLLRSRTWEGKPVWEDASSTFLDCAALSAKALRLECEGSTEPLQYYTPQDGLMVGADVAFVLNAFRQGLKLCTAFTWVASCAIGIL